MNTEQAIAKSRERFVRETAEHEMTVRHDDGLYRHLRFQKPGSWSYGFDLVTWPGYLAVVGDAGDYVFSRTRDMFEFFSPSGARGGFEDERWGINPGYWSEKLQAPSPNASMRYSEGAFRARVNEWLEQRCEDLDDSEARGDLRRAVEEQLLGDVAQSEEDARRALADFEHGGFYPLSDAWEWDLREYDWQFLWCCWAIVWGLGQYRAATPAEAVSV